MSSKMRFSDDGNVYSRPPKANTKKRNFPSLFDKKEPYFSGIQRFGIAKLHLYLQDPFHTLLNLPWLRFIAVFFLVYLSQFFVFAILYYLNHGSCVSGMDNFAHAVWMSSNVASTLGFTNVRPNANCPGVNVLIMVHVITSSLINCFMLGLVFARFSAPFKRVSTIRFSDCAVVNRHESGYWCIQFRVANVRKHQLLKPEIKVMLTALDSITPSNYGFDYLEVHEFHKEETNLQLGFPANITHLVKPGTPLYHLSLQEMEARLMEVLVFVDGVDAMTSRSLQARKSYAANFCLMNERFRTMHLEVQSGKVGLDFSGFDQTCPATDELLREYENSPQLKGMPLPDVQHHLGHLRHLTFKRMTESYAAPQNRGEVKDGASPSVTAVPLSSIPQSSSYGQETVIELSALDTSSKANKDQEGVPLRLQLHSLCDAVANDPTASLPLKNQAAAIKRRYPLENASGSLL